MPSAPTHEHHSRLILDAFESDHGVSQRSLAKELGIALGLTNLLVKRLVRKGWVRVIHIKPNRVRYLITPAGIAEKTRMSRAYFESSVQFYRQARDRIQQQFSALSTDWPGDGATRLPKRIVFYGAGEVAEIGYICLVETDLQLVGVVDVARPGDGSQSTPRHDAGGLCAEKQCLAATSSRPGPGRFRSPWA